MTNTDVGVRLRYRILYNNGAEDVFIQPVDEDNLEKIQDITAIISEAFEGDVSGQIKLGDGIKSIIVKLSEVSRVGIEAIVEEEAE